MNSNHNITVLILAAGRGERMRPLTDTTPKPLLKVGELSLIEHLLVRLANQGFQHVVINVAHLGDQIMNLLGDGSQYKLTISYSDERESGALETAGGIIKALPLIQSERFIVANADVWSDFDFSKLVNFDLDNCIALTKNPAHNLKGDFVFEQNSMKSKGTGFAKKIKPDNKKDTYTYTGISILSKALFAGIPEGKSALAPLLFESASKSELGALVHNGVWEDIGTPERLDAIRQAY